jgi:uncharacterized membrane protein
MKTIIGLFDNRNQALAVVEELRGRRIPPHDISLVASNAEGWYADESLPEADAETGAGIGAVVGAVGGLLVGLGAISLPGVGPVVSAGWLLSTLAGSATGVILGGAAGSLVGALTAQGIDDPDAQVYAESLKRGGTLVVARVEEKVVTAAEAIMVKHRVDVAARRDELTSEGWARFDDSSLPHAEAAKPARADL